MFLENLLRVIILGGFGIMAHRFTETLLFLICFPAIRAHAGGIHAKTSIGCTILMLGGTCIGKP